MHHGEASTVLALPWGRPAEIKMLFTALFRSSNFHVLQLVKGHQCSFVSYKDATSGQTRESPLLKVFA